MAYSRRYQAPTRMSFRQRYQLPGVRKSLPCPSSLSSSDSRKRSVEEWEQQFGMKWRQFLTSKEGISEEDKVMLWDDSAGKMFFFQAERRFWSKNSLSNARLPSPDLYIDCNIDWNSRIDLRLLMELEAAQQESKRSVPTREPCAIKLEDVKPTGWDVCCDDWNKPRVLTGMIVGGSVGYENLHGEAHKPTNCKQPRESFYESGYYKPSRINRSRYRVNHQVTRKNLRVTGPNPKNFSYNR